MAKAALWTDIDAEARRCGQQTGLDTPAYYIQKLSESLKKRDFTNVTYIPTENKGYRANGNRHPHSWSIVDKENLMNWILNRKSTKMSFRNE